MKLAVSTIAWPATADDEVMPILRDGGVEGIELAPTRYWPDPTTASASEIATVQQRWADNGTPIIACQSLFFGRDDLGLFGSAETRARTAAYLARVIEVGAALGARVLNFGAPHLRRIGDVTSERALEIARAFFRDAAAVASGCDVHLCLEPLSREYGCEFLNTTRECVAFLESVSAPGLGIQLDAATLHMNSEPLDEAFGVVRPWMRHFHVSEPDLGPLGSGGVPHPALAECLRRIGYGGWVSIEMREPRAPPLGYEVGAAVNRARADYLRETRSLP